MPTHPLDRRVLLKTAPNFRELGGIPVADSTVRARAYALSFGDSGETRRRPCRGRRLGRADGIRPEDRRQRDGALDNLLTRRAQSGSTYLPTMPKTPRPLDYS